MCIIYTNMLPCVTEQHGDWLLVTMYTHTTEICGKEIGFHEQRSQFEGAGSIPALCWPRSWPLSQSTENQPLPGRLKSKARSRSSAVLLICSLRLLLKWVSASPAPGALSPVPESLSPRSSSGLWASLSVFVPALRIREWKQSRAMWGAALGHGVPRSGAQWGMHPSMGPYLSELASNLRGLGAISAIATPACAGQSKTAPSAHLRFKSPLPESQLVSAFSTLVWSPFSTRGQKSWTTGALYKLCSTESQDAYLFCAISLLCNPSLHEEWKLLLIFNSALGVFSPAPAFCSDFTWLLCYTSSVAE